MREYILSLDQGTTNARAILFDHGAQVIAIAQQEIRQIYPRPGWVEHDPHEVWHTQISVARETIEKSGIALQQIAAIGITNQRETTVLWDRETGKPISNAIVWQCRRTADLCTKLSAIPGLPEMIQERTGLVVDPYFSGTKIKWLLDTIPEARSKARRGDLMFGTIDTWLLYNLTGEHLTDVTNASRTPADPGESVVS